MSPYGLCVHGRAAEAFSPSGTIYLSPHLLQRLLRLNQLGKFAPLLSSTRGNAVTLHSLAGGEAEALAADGCASLGKLSGEAGEAQSVQIPQEQTAFRETGLWVFISITLFD